MTTIYVRKLYADAKEYMGKSYTEYKIYATSGLYYTTRKPFPDFVEEGAALEVEAEPTKNPKYFKLKSVKLLNSKSLGTSETNNQAGKALSSTPTPPPQPLPSIDPVLQAQWIIKALDALKKAGMDSDIGNALLVELVRQYVSQWMSDRIATEQKARWGK